MVIHCSLSDCKSPQISRTLLSILAALDNVVVWIVSASPTIYNSSCSLTKHTNYNWYHRHPHAPHLFSSLERSKNLSLFSFSLNLSLWSAWTAKSPTWKVLFFFFFFFCKASCLIFWSVYISKSLIILCIPFSRMDSDLCMDQLIVSPNLNLLHNSQWITFHNHRV